MKRVLLILLLITINVTAQNNPDKLRDGVKTPFIQYENLTTNEKLAIPQVKGTLVYDTDFNRLQVYNGSVWVNFFDNNIDDTDDITEGFLNKFLTTIERAKLVNIDFNTSSTFVGSNSGLNISGSDVYTLVGRESGRDATDATGLTAIGVFAGRDSQGSKNTFIGWIAGRDSQGEEKTATGFSSGVNSTGANASFYGVNSGLNAKGEDITVIGANAGIFPLNSATQTPNSTAIGASTIIDKANQAVIGNSQVTELKIGETLVIDKNQIVNGSEGVLVTKKVGGKTVVEVSSAATPTNVVLSTGSSSYTGNNYGAVKVRKNENGLVSLEGIALKSINSNYGAVIGIMPVGYRPIKKKDIAVLTSTNAMGTISTALRMGSIRLWPNGDITVIDCDSYINLDNISFYNN